MRTFTVMHVFLLFYYYKKAKAAETAKLEKQMENEDMVEENLEAWFVTILRRRKFCYLYTLQS